MLPPPLNHPLIDRETGLVTRPWAEFYSQLGTGVNGAVTGPASSTDNAIARWDGTSGLILQNSGITVADAASGTLSGTNTGDQDLFKTIAVSGQSDVVADSPTDTLTLVAGSGVTLTTTPSTDTVIIAATGTGGTVTTTGSPSSGNLAKFSGATSITNADLTGDVTTSGGVATTIANNAVTDAKLRDSAAVSVIGRSANSSGDPGDIAAASNNTVLKRASNALAFGAVDLTADVTGDLPYANLVQASGASLLLGRGSAGGAGDWQEITLGAGLSMASQVLSTTGGGVGTTTIVLAASDETRTSTTSVSNDAELFFSVVAAGVYVVQGWILYNAATGGDFLFDWTLPSGSGLHGGIRPPTNIGSGVANTTVNMNFTAIGTDVSMGGAGVTTDLLAWLFATMTIGVTGGTVHFQFAQAASSGTATTRLAGSNLQVTRVS